MDFVDGTLYQASSGGSLVAIIADYPGLLPVSHVSKVGVLLFRKGVLRYATPYAHVLRLYRNGHQDTTWNPWGLLSKGRLGKAG